MEIVTDSGVDLSLSTPQLTALHIHVVPLVVTMEEISYKDGRDVQADEFYRLLAASEKLPTTSAPSVGDFVDVYRVLAQKKTRILSIHMSSGLSGTCNAARVAAGLVPEADITQVDTLTLSAASGWQVQVAAKAAQAGWTVDRIIALLKQIREASETLFTLDQLEYLIHGGRISHMQGLIASLMKIKPIIGVEKQNGTYVQRGRARTFPGAVRELVDLIARQHKPGSSLVVQVMHANNPAGAALLREQIDASFQCKWLPIDRASLVLSAHTGPSLIGAAYAPASVFDEIPLEYPPMA